MMGPAHVLDSSVSCTDRQELSTRKFAAWAGDRPLSASRNSEPRLLSEATAICPRAVSCAQTNSTLYFIARGTGLMNALACLSAVRLSIQICAGHFSGSPHPEILQP